MNFAVAVLIAVNTLTLVDSPPIYSAKGHCPSNISRQSQNGTSCNRNVVFVDDTTKSLAADFATPESTADFIINAWERKDYAALLSAYDVPSRTLLVSGARSVIATIVATVEAQTGKSPNFDVNSLSDIEILKHLFVGSTITRAQVTWKDKGPTTATATLCAETKLASSGKSMQTEKPLELRKTSQGWLAHLDATDAMPEVQGTPTQCM